MWPSLTVLHRRSMQDVPPCMPLGMTLMYKSLQQIQTCALINNAYVRVFLQKKLNNTCMHLCCRGRASSLLFFSRFFVSIKKLIQPERPRLLRIADCTTVQDHRWFCWFALQFSDHACAAFVVCICELRRVSQARWHSNTTSFRTVNCYLAS